MVPDSRRAPLTEPSVEFLSTVLALQLCHKVSIFGFSVGPPPVAASTSEGELGQQPAERGDVQDEYRYVSIFRASATGRRHPFFWLGPWQVATAMRQLKCVSFQGLVLVGSILHARVLARVRIRP